MNARLIRVAGVAACALLAQAAAAGAQTLTYTGSLGYASDRYIFTEPTHTYSLHNSLQLGVGRVRLSAGVPLVYQDSWAVTYVGGVLVPTAGPDHEAVRQREPGQQIPMTRERRGQNTSAGGNGGGGMGQGNFSLLALVDTVTEPGDYQLHFADPLLSAAVDLYRGYGALRSVSLTAAAKAPLADESVGMSTGEWDFAGGASIAVAGGVLLFYADVTYWRFGDFADLELQDGVSVSAGAGLPLGTRGALMTSFSTSQKIIATADAPASLSALLSYDVGSRTSLNAGASFGLSESVSGAVFYAGWSVKLMRPVTEVALR